MATLAEARAAVRAIRKEARTARAESRDAELSLFEAWDCAAVKPPPRTVNPSTGKARRDWSRGSWDWMRGRPQWQLRILIGGAGAVYGPDELLDVLQGAGVLSASDDLDTWADRVLSGRQQAKVSPADVARATGHPVALVARVLEGDLDDCARHFQAWADEMAGDLAAQYASVRALQAEAATAVERLAEKVRHERYDVGRSWADIGRDLGVTRARALRIAHPNGKPRDDQARRPRVAETATETTNDLIF